jgi:hypothetical protein
LSFSFALGESIKLFQLIHKTTLWANLLVELSGFGCTIPSYSAFVELFWR